MKQQQQILEQKKNHNYDNNKKDNINDMNILSEYMILTQLQLYELYMYHMILLEPIQYIIG